MTQSNATTLVYWSGEIGMELVDKWEIKGKIHDGPTETTLTGILNF